jgi:hypothetical protein
MSGTMQELSEADGRSRVKSRTGTHSALDNRLPPRESL